MPTTQAQEKARPKRARTPQAVRNERLEGTPGQYAREAISEWGKAARLAAAAISRGNGERPPLKERLNPAKTDKGGRLGNVADFLMAKTGGKAGKLGSKFAVGSRIVGRLRGDDSASGGGNGTDDADRVAPIPIQEAMEVAVPIKAAYELARKFQDYPEFIDRIEAVEKVDGRTAVFEVKVRGVKRQTQIEIADERPNRRIDWKATEGFEHAGVVSFHELAPSLTHIELSVDLETHGLIQRFTRTAHLTHHAIRGDMHRFKAWAELWEEVDEPEELEAPEVEDEQELPDDYADEGQAGGEPEDFDEDEEVPDDYEEEAEVPEDYMEEEDLEDDEEVADDEQEMEYESYDGEDEPAPARTG